MEHASDLLAKSTVAESAEQKRTPPLPAAPAANAAGNGGSYAVGGLVCLIVGIFLFGVPLSLMAISLGSKAIKNGSTTFGAIIRAAGWIELALTLIVLAASR